MDTGLKNLWYDFAAVYGEIIKFLFNDYNLIYTKTKINY